MSGPSLFGAASDGTETGIKSPEDIIAGVQNRAGVSADTDNTGRVPVFNNGGGEGTVTGISSPEEIIANVQQRQAQTKTIEDQKAVISQYLDNNTIEQMGGEDNYNWLMNVVRSGTPDEVQKAYQTVVSSTAATKRQEAEARQRTALVYTQGHSSEMTTPCSGNPNVNAVLQAAHDQNFDAGLALAVAAVESGGGDVNEIHMAGHDGMFQIEPETAQNYGVADKYPDWQTDPYQNAMAGIEVLKAKIDEKDGDTWAGVAHYNGGGDPDYLPKVQAAYDHTSNMADSVTNGGASYDGFRLTLPDSDEFADQSGNVDGPTEDTHMKLRVLDNLCYQKFGQHLIVSSSYREGDPNNHGAGVAFDVSGGIVDDPDARQWLEQAGPAVGLFVIPEYQGEAGAEFAHGDNVHFSNVEPGIYGQTRDAEGHWSEEHAAPSIQSILNGSGSATSAVKGKAHYHSGEAMGLPMLCIIGKTLLCIFDKTILQGLPVIRQQEVLENDQNIGDVKHLQDTLFHKGEAVFNVDDFEAEKNKRSSSYTIQDYAKEWLVRKTPNVKRDTAAYQALEKEITQQMGNAYALTQKETKKAALKDDFKLANGYRTESGRPLKEADKDEFIIKPDGSKDFGTIDEHIEKATNGILKAGKIRLRVGWDNGGKGSGLFHAKYHEKDAQNMGYRSIEDLISDVGSSFDAVYVRKATQQGLHDTYVLVKYPNKDQNGRGASVPIYFELQPDGNSYNIITAIPKGQRSLTRELKKEHLIYSDQANQSTVTPNSSSVSDLSDNNVGDGQDSMPASAKSNVLSTSIISQKVKKGKKYSVREANDQLTRSKDDLKAEIKEAFPNAKEIRDDGDRITFIMPNGSHIVVDLKNEIVLTDEELAQAKKEHHIDDNGNVVVEGYAEVRGKDAYMALAQGSRENTGFHEAYHLAEGAVLTDREKAAIKKAIPDAEKRADKYAEWVEARKHGRGTAWGKLFQKIKDFATKMKKIFTGVETVHDVFRQIESGKVWERNAKASNAVWTSVTNTAITGKTRVPIVDVSNWGRMNLTNAAKKKAIIEELKGASFKFIDSQGRFATKLDSKHFVNSSSSIQIHLKTRQKIFSNIGEILNNAIYVEKHPDVRHGKSGEYIELFSAVKDGGKVVLFRIVAKEGDKAVGRYNIGDVKFYDILQQKKDVPHHLPHSDRQNGGTSLDTVSVSELLRNVNDRHNRPYVNSDGTLNYEFGVLKALSTNDTSETALDATRKFDTCCLPH